MKNYRLLGVWLWLLAMPALQAESESERLPPRVAVIVDGLIPLCRGGAEPRANNAKKRFIELLSRLASEADESVSAWASANEGTDLRAKLIVVALDYAARTQLYEDVSQGYFAVPKGYKSQAVTRDMSGVPGLKIDETVRLPFEMWILAPPYESEYDNALNEASNSLGSIRNLKSLPVFKLLAERKTGNPDEIIEFRRFAVVGLIYLPSEASLKLILGCADVGSLPESKGLLSVQRNEWMRQYVRQRFNRVESEFTPSGEDSKLKSDWIRVFENFPRKEVPPSQETLFDEFRSLLK